MKKLLLTLVLFSLVGCGQHAPEVSDDKMMEEDAAMIEDVTVMTDDEMTKEDAMTTDDNDKMMEDEAVITEEETMSEEKVETKKAGIYAQYAPSGLKMAEKAVLDFYAPWCPSCQALDADIKANVFDIPEDVVILRVDYDSFDDLKKKYGVTYQHTFVQVDREGNQIKKWSGSPTLAKLLEEIQ